MYNGIVSGPVEKRAPIRQDDNLKTGEGKFVTPDKVKYQPTERPKQIRPTDNLKMGEGRFITPDKTKYQPAERPKQVKHEDNLKPEGSFDTPEKPKYQPAERPKQVKPQDNLKPEGSFDKPEKPKYRQVERVKPVKPIDNLRTGEGEFEGRRKTDTVHTKVERVEIKKHKDQITLNDGKMQTDTTASSTFKKQPVQRHVVEDIVKKQKMRSNITLGDDTTILRTTNQMNFNTITTQKKDQRVEKTTDVTDKNGIRDGTIAITTMKVTTVLENEKDHTPIKHVIRKGGQTNIREEVIRETSDTDVINRKNIVNEQYHVNETNQNVVNKRYVVNQHDASNRQNIDNVSRTTITNDQQSSDVKRLNEITDRRANQQYHTSSIVTSQSDQNNLNRSSTKQTTDSTDKKSSVSRATATSADSSNISTSCTTADSMKAASDMDSTLSKRITIQSEQTTATTQRSNINGDIAENTVREHTVTRSTPSGRQPNYSSDILNINDTRSGGKTSVLTSQSDKINNQLHLRQHDSTSSNIMSSTSASSTNRYNKSSAHTSTSNISSIIHDGQSSSPVHRNSSMTTESQRRDYVSLNTPDQSQQNIHPQHQHHRKNVLTSSTDVNNAVFHRKANLSTNSNEALHSNSMSSTAAIQRKSISNLHDQAIYSNSSSDRKSYSSLHRQGKETISHSTSNSTIQTHQHQHQQQSGSTSHIVSSGSGSGSGQNKHTTFGTASSERAQKIVKKDNLSSSFGNEFYGKSESKAYGSFTSGHNHHVVDRTAVRRRSNQSSISLGDGQNHSSSVYRREYQTAHSGPCPAAHLEKSTFTHTRDTKSHKFFKSSHQ